jgi:hypothetical protein
MQRPEFIRRYLSLGIPVTVKEISGNETTWTSWKQA